MPEETRSADPPAPPARAVRAPWIAWGFASAAFVFALCACGVYGFDAGMLLAKGRWIWEHRALPRPEEFLVQKNPGFPYLDRWLNYVLWWLAWKAGGWNGLIALKMLLVGGTFALLWRAARPASPAACAAATIFAALLMYERWDVRTELAAHLSAALVLALLPGEEGRVSRAAWALPAVCALAINLHALNVLCPVLVFASAAAAWLRAETRAQAKPLLATGGLCVLALLANPQGWYVVAVPFEYLHRYRTGPEWYRGWIGELQPVAAGDSVATAAPWLLVPAAILLQAVQRRRIRPFDAFLVALAALAAFSVRRNVAAAGVLLFPVLARGLDAAAAAIRERLADNLRPRVAWGARGALAAAMLFGAAMSTSDLWAVGERTGRRAGFGVNRLTLPVDACDFLRGESNLAGPTFVNWDAGGTFMHMLYGQSLPTMNGEGDFSLETLEEYEKVTRDPARHFDDFARKYRLKAALLTHQSADTRPVAAWLRSHPDWVLRYRDACALLFARRDAFPRPIPDAPPPGLTHSVPGGLWPWSEGRRRAAAVEAFRLGTVCALFSENEAQPAYERALELWPDYAEAHGNLGALLAQKNDPRGPEELREAIRLRPGYATPYRNLAVWHATRGEAARAEAVLREGLEEVEDRGILRDLAAFLRARGASAEAEAMERRAGETRR